MQYRELHVLAGVRLERPGRMVEPMGVCFDLDWGAGSGCLILALFLV